MKLVGQHAVSLSGIRALAIECHALDLSAKELLLFSIHRDDNGLTRAAYDELLTNKMLSLAIALRTKFYQGVPYAGTERYMESVGFLELKTKTMTKGWKFTIKDVCDKIIHADTVTRQYEGDCTQPVTLLEGIGPGTTRWTLGFSLATFADCLLWWLNEEHEA
jgi:hypothetical protein